MNFTKTSMAFLTTVLLINACKKVDDPTPLPVAVAPAKGLYVLSEGTSANDSKLSFYNSATSAVTGDYFAQQNPSQTQLGALANDAIIYGSKMYVMLTISGRVTVLKASNAIVVDTISFKINGLNKQPRYAVGAKGKVYVTCSDNTVAVIDTTTLKIVKTIVVGSNPEGIAATANYLYVANSGGFNFPNVDSTVSLVDLNTEMEIRKIKVGLNPYKVEVSPTGNVFVSAYGNYTTIPPSISVINGAINLTSTNLGSAFNYSNVRISGDIAYLYNNYGGTGTAKMYNTTTNTTIRNEFVTDSTVIIQAPYGLNIDEFNGDVYIADARNFIASGTVTCFNAAGKKKFSFSVAPGVSPNKVLFLR